nr:hypothetical protein [Desulfonema ishimotonii]
MQIDHQVQDLGLDGNVQGADGFVCNDQGWVQDNGPGNGDALALAAGELVGYLDK